MLIKCDHCGIEVDKKPSQVKTNLEKGRKNYCSNDCKKLGQFTGKLCVCGTCGKEIYKTQSEIKRSKSGQVFCNKSCACSFNNTLLRSKENNPNWKNGNTSYVKSAYENYLPECTICGFNDLDALEVHHIDEDRSNGNIDNLIVLCANHHSLVHSGTLKITDEIKLKRKF
jgi:hypothetical protein